MRTIGNGQLHQHHAGQPEPNMGDRIQSPMFSGGRLSKRSLRQDWQDTAGAVLHFLRFDGAHHGGAGAVVDADADG